MTASVQEWLATANAVVPKLAPGELKELMSRADVLLIDVRDAPEVHQSGKLRGARHISRGMLEFRADSATAYHDPALRKDRTLVLYCASGGRSALAAKTLLDMGYTSVYNAGGFKDLAAAGLETEAASD
jgi:rhodanese-related sulfurtransferase